MDAGRVMSVCWMLICCLPAVCANYLVYTGVKKLNSVPASTPVAVLDEGGSTFPVFQNIIKQPWALGWLPDSKALLWTDTEGGVFGATSLTSEPPPHQIYTVIPRESGAPVAKGLHVLDSPTANVFSFLLTSGRTLMLHQGTLHGEGAVNYPLWSSNESFWFNAGRGDCNFPGSKLFTKDGNQTEVIQECREACENSTSPCRYISYEPITYGSSVWQCDAYGPASYSWDCDFHKSTSTSSTLEFLWWVSELQTIEKVDESIYVAGVDNVRRSSFLLRLDGLKLQPESLEHANVSVVALDLPYTQVNGATTGTGIAPSFFVHNGTIFYGGPSGIYTEGAQARWLDLGTFSISIVALHLDCPSSQASCIIYYTTTKGNVYSHPLMVTPPGRNLTQVVPIYDGNTGTKNPIYDIIAYNSFPQQPLLRSVAMSVMLQTEGFSVTGGLLSSVYVKQELNPKNSLLVGVLLATHDYGAQLIDSFSCSAFSWDSSTNDLLRTKLSDGSGCGGGVNCPTVSSAVPLANTVLNSSYPASPAGGAIDEARGKYIFTWKSNNAPQYSGGTSFFMSDLDAYKTAQGTGPLKVDRIPVGSCATSGTTDTMNAFADVETGDYVYITTGQRFFEGGSLCYFTAASSTVSLLRPLGTMDSDDPSHMFIDVDFKARVVVYIDYKNHQLKKFTFDHPTVEIILALFPGTISFPEGAVTIAPEVQPDQQQWVAWTVQSEDDSSASSPIWLSSLDPSKPINGSGTNRVTATSPPWRADHGWDVQELHYTGNLGIHHDTIPLSAVVIPGNGSPVTWEYWSSMDAPWEGMWRQSSLAFPQHETPMEFASALQADNGRLYYADSTLQRIGSFPIDGFKSQGVTTMVSTWFDGYSTINGTSNPVTMFPSGPASFTFTIADSWGDRIGLRVGPYNATNRAVWSLGLIHQNRSVPVHKPFHVLPPNATHDSDVIWDFDRDYMYFYVDATVPQRLRNTCFYEAGTLVRSAIGSPDYEVVVDIMGFVSQGRAPYCGMVPNSAVIDQKRSIVYFTGLGSNGGSQTLFMHNITSGNTTCLTGYGGSPGWNSSDITYQYDFTGLTLSEEGMLFAVAAPGQSGAPYTIQSTIVKVDVTTKTLIPIGIPNTETAHTPPALPLTLTTVPGDPTRLILFLSQTGGAQAPKVGIVSYSFAELTRSYIPKDTRYYLFGSYTNLLVPRFTAPQFGFSQDPAIVSPSDLLFYTGGNVLAPAAQAFKWVGGAWAPLGAPDALKSSDSIRIGGNLIYFTSEDNYQSDVLRCEINNMIEAPEILIPGLTHAMETVKYANIGGSPLLYWLQAERIVFAWIYGPDMFPSFDYVMLPTPVISDDQYGDPETQDVIVTGDANEATIYLLQVYGGVLQAQYTWGSTHALSDIKRVNSPTPSPRTVPVQFALDTNCNKLFMSKAFTEYSRVTDANIWEAAVPVTADTNMTLALANTSALNSPSLLTVTSVDPRSCQPTARPNPAYPKSPTGQRGVPYKQHIHSTPYTPPITPTTSMPTPQTTSAPGKPGHAHDAGGSPFLQRNKWTLIGAGGGVVALVALVAVCVCRRRKQAKFVSLNTPLHDSSERYLA